MNDIKKKKNSCRHNHHRTEYKEEEKTTNLQILSQNKDIVEQCDHIC